MNNDKRMADGKFGPGNGGGPGNPHARQTARLRALYLEIITVDEFREVVNALLKKAKEGNLPAIQEVLNRSAGKPSEVVNPDTVDIEELRQKIERDTAAVRADFPAGLVKSRIFVP